MSVLLSDSTYECVAGMIKDLLDEWEKIRGEVAKNHPGNPEAIKWVVTRKVAREIADTLENKAKHFSEIEEIKINVLDPSSMFYDQMQLEFKNAAREIRAKYGIRVE